MRDVADLMADRWPMDTQQRAPKFFQAMRDIDTALAQPADEDAWLEKAVDIAQEFYDRAFRADTEIQLRAHLRTRPAREGFVSVNEQTIRAAAEVMEKEFANLGNFSCTKEVWADKIRGWLFIREPVERSLRKAMIEAAKGDGK